MSTILVVDDNPINLKLARILLVSEGHKVKTAGSAEEVLELLKTLTPRLILMDIQLPGMDGLQCARLLKAHDQYKHIVIVALTAYAMKGDKEKAMLAGFDGYITKPVDPSTLSATVANYIKLNP